MIVYNEYQNDELRLIFTSRYPEFGKRVLKIYHPSEGVQYDKLRLIVHDFNKEVRGIDRSYTIPDDYDQLIRILTQNQYRLEYSNLAKTPQYGGATQRTVYRSARLILEVLALKLLRKP